MEYRKGTDSPEPLLLSILLVCCPCASALNPSLAINQYAHTAWTIGGSFKGTITSMAQTPDGYLWLGTEFGLLRFDGVRSLPWQPPVGEHLPGGIIRGLLAARDGRLWIGTNEGLASWKDGNLTHYPELTGQGVTSLLEDREGTIWAGVSAISIGRLCAIQSGSAHCYGEDGSFGSGVIALYEDREGNLWAGAATRLWRWKPGTPKLYPIPDPVQAMIEGDNDALLIATRGGIKQLVGGKVEAYPLPGAGPQFTSYRLLRDRDGGLWIGATGGGLSHVHQGRTDVFARSDGLSGDHINSLFEDREGNIWVATLNGFDRFREFAVLTISVKQGLSNADVTSILAARDGSVWLGTADGLDRWNNGQITIYRKRRSRAVIAAPLGPVREITDSALPDDTFESLFQDDRGRIWVSTPRGVAYFENGRFTPVNAVPAGPNVWSIAEDRARNLWISQDQSLLHLLGGRVVERISWAKLGRKDWALALFPDPVEGGLWLGFREGGLAYFKDGQVRASYAGGDGLGNGPVTSLQLDRSGTLWAATQGGLSCVKNGHVTTLTSESGLPCDTVHWVMEDNDHSFWLYTTCGLVRIARPELDAWVTDPKRKIQAAVFDDTDGVRSHAVTTQYSPLAARSTDGRLWFLRLDGVSVIDPRHLPFNKLPPPVYIERITADGKAYWQNSVGSLLRLPPLVRNLEIDYTDLSLVAPEKNLFRFKLEGWDRDWHDVHNRQAFYTNLFPGNYRFRVAACNNSGVWNEAGASLDFSIAPAWYQTLWFRASCMAAFLGLLWALYRFRLHQIAQEFHVRLAERLGERTRIARELHDDIGSGLSQIAVLSEVLSRRMGEDDSRFTEPLGQIASVARDLVASLSDIVWAINPNNDQLCDLTHRMRRFASDVFTARNIAFGFSAPSDGQDIRLVADLRRNIFLIFKESVNNIMRHSGCTRADIEFSVERDRLVLRLSDDGKGFDPDPASNGHGLTNMRARAKSLGGEIAISSEANHGTNITLTVPLNDRHLNRW
jgi:signal transduction histidine kinase/ligand-binding sensor domain-containing protein